MEAWKRVAAAVRNGRKVTPGGKGSEGPGQLKKGKPMGPKNPNAKTFTDSKGVLRYIGGKPVPKGVGSVKPGTPAPRPVAKKPKHPNAKTYTQRQRIYDPKYDTPANAANKRMKRPNAVRETLHRIGGPAVGKPVVKPIKSAPSLIRLPSGATFPRPNKRQGR